MSSSITSPAAAIATAPRASFIRLCRTPYVNNLIKEAKRVKYLVTRDADFWVEVRDDANNALVFKAVQMQKGIWGVTFSTTYWNENE